MATLIRSMRDAPRYPSSAAWRLGAGRGGRGRGSVGLLDADQFDVEQEHGVGTDLRRGVFAVGEIGGDGELPLGADWHHLEGLGPAGDHLIDGKLGGLIALVGAVEFGAIDGGAAILGNDG